MSNIRTMVPADYPAVAAIANDAAERALVGLPTWETAEDVARELASLRQAEFLVAEDGNGKVIGVAGYAMQEQGAAAIYGPLVAESGHGVGASLAFRVESLAHQHGATLTSMLIGLENRSGAAWAEWRGYQRDSEHPEMLLTWIYPGELRREGAFLEGMVRRAQPADLDRILELYDLCFLAGSDTRQLWESRLDECWVLVHGARVVAFLWLSEAAAVIRLLCVDPSLRRSGVGTRLLAEALAHVWERRPQKMGVAVRLEHKAMVAFCRHLGFRREVPVASWMKVESEALGDDDQESAKRL